MSLYDIPIRVETLEWFCPSSSLPNPYEPVLLLIQSKYSANRYIEGFLHTETDDGVPEWRCITLEGSAVVKEPWQVKAWCEVSPREASLFWEEITSSCFPL